MIEICDKLFYIPLLIAFVWFLVLIVREGPLYAITVMVLVAAVMMILVFIVAVGMVIFPKEYMFIFIIGLSLITVATIIYYMEKKWK